MMMVFLVLLGIEGLSYMLNDENKKRLPFYEVTPKSWTS